MQFRTRMSTRLAIVAAAVAIGTTGWLAPTPAAAAGIEIRMQDDAPAGTPQRGGRLSLLIRLDATNLDPHTAIETSAYVVIEQIYESLLESVRGEVRPAIAERWDVSADGLTYTFHLRANAKFHSGRTVTSEDVKYSIERIRNPATASPRARSFDGISAIETPDPRTVVLRLARPQAPLLALLSTNGASIVDRAVAEAPGGLNGSVGGGSGPFVLAQRVVGQRMVLNRNPDYWNPGLPHLDGIDVTFNPDDNARAAAIRSGTVNFLWRAAPEFIDRLKADPQLKWYGGEGSLSLHLRLNTSRKPYDDVRVRQAIYHALDREEILEIANSGHGQPLNAGYLPPDRWGSVKTPIYGAPDIAKAKALLAEAGLANGFTTNLLVNSTSAFQVRSAEVIQQQLAKIGIRVTLRLAEATVTNAALRRDDFDLFQSGFSLSLDPDERFSSAFVTDGGTNYGKWSDPAYDALVIAARSETDRAKREALYQQAETILALRGPVAMTWVSADYDVVRREVMGYVGDSSPSYRFYRHLWLAR
jgi:peptide/nickel transport system substrate-binding protein